jgi:hypothetical protein
MSQMALAVAWFQNETSELCTAACRASATACIYIDGDGGCSTKVDMVRRLAGCADERILEVLLPTTCDDLCRAACDSFVKADKDMIRRWQGWDKERARDALLLSAVVLVDRSAAYSFTAEM